MSSVRSHCLSCVVCSFAEPPSPRNTYTQQKRRVRVVYGPRPWLFDPPRERCALAFWNRENGIGDIYVIFFLNIISFSRSIEFYACRRRSPVL